MIVNQTIDSTYEEEGYVVYKCSECNFQKEEVIPVKTHSYSSTYYFDDENHWNLCTDAGYENLRLNITAHIDSNEIIIENVISVTARSVE